MHSVREEGLEGEMDGRIWQAAQGEDRFLITQDLDFSDVRTFRPGTHCGILLVRLREPGRLALTIAVSQVFSTQDVSGWRGCFVVLTERKLRILRPQTH